MLNSEWSRRFFLVDRVESCGISSGCGLFVLFFLVSSDTSRLNLLSIDVKSMSNLFFFSLLLSTLSILKTVYYYYYY